MTPVDIPRLILCLLLTLAVGKAGSEERQIELPDCNTQMHAPLEVGGKQAVLLVFIGHNNFGTEMSMEAIRAIVTDYHERVAIYLVQSERGSRRMRLWDRKFYALRPSALAERLFRSLVRFFSSPAF